MENERLARIETQLESVSKQLDELKQEIKQEINQLRDSIRDLDTRMAVREVFNGEFRGDLANVQNDVHTIFDDIDGLKRFVWIGFGVLITLQFVLPLFVQIIK